MYTQVNIDLPHESRLEEVLARAGKYFQIKQMYARRVHVSEACTNSHLPTPIPTPNNTPHTTYHPTQPSSTPTTTETPNNIHNIPVSEVLNKGHNSDPPEYVIDMKGCIQPQLNLILMKTMTLSERRLISTVIDAILERNIKYTNDLCMGSAWKQVCIYVYEYTYLLVLICVCLCTSDFIRCILVHFHDISLCMCMSILCLAFNIIALTLSRLSSFSYSISQYLSM